MATPSMQQAATPRELADAYVYRLVDLDTTVATALGVVKHDDRVPDFSPAAQQKLTDVAIDALSRLDLLETHPPEQGWSDVERRCAAVLRDRLRVTVEAHQAGEHLREIRNIFGPPQQVRQLFSMMPTVSAQDWVCIGARMTKVDAALRSYVAALEEGRENLLLAAPRQVSTVIDQLQDWVSSGWFESFIEPGARTYPELAAQLQSAADSASQGTAELRDYLRTTYLPACEGTPDAIGAERYALNARRWTGGDLDLIETYRWGWQEFLTLRTQMEELADHILPGSTPVEAMAHLDSHGDVIDGVDAIQERLQAMMDQAIHDLDGQYFDIAEPIRTVRAMIAPSGSAAAPYYSRPSLDFTRPGQTWLPTLGQTRFPLYDLISTWYHEGVPGHHLQLAQWIYLAPQLSIYQTTLGSSSGATEGWALYAERLMDELGYLDTDAKMGYLDCQIMRAIRVVIDIGMHLELTIPDDSPLAPGQQWTPQLAEEFFLLHSGRPADFIASEIVRYLGWPGQAISYKVGERAWLAGREGARAAAADRGEDFDLKAWHMAALSLGAMGLSDLESELARL